MKKQKSKQGGQIYLNRVKCDCVAQKHELINNCLGCGKVVCAQQGEGPCLYCNKVVTRPDTTLIIPQNDQTLFPTLSKEQLKNVSQQRSKAILHKNKLVQRDRSDNAVQNIIDQQMDYYDVSENQWLDEESRQKALDRILEKTNFVEKEQFKVKASLNPLTGEWEREEFSYDEEQFRKEGRDFIADIEQQNFKERMKKTKQSHHLDDRMLKNEKIKELCEDILKKERSLPEAVIKKKIELQKKIVSTDLILQEETQPQTVQAQK